MDHQPIDYSKTVFSGNGETIIPLLSQAERRLWNIALPYQDYRNQKGHTEITAYFALKLLDNYKAKREIVIPAAILHDIGWSQMSDTELKLFFDKNCDRYEPVLRERHQEEGVLLSKKLLKDLNEQGYPRPSTNEICKIISQHDTREGFYSLEDGIVRSADRLWRFTLPHLKAAMENRGISADKVGKMMRRWLNQEDFFYDFGIKQMALSEREATLIEYNKNK